MKKILKIFVILNIIIICTFFLNTPEMNVNAFSDIFSEGDAFIQKGEGDDEKIPIKDVSDMLYKILFAIGVVLAVGIGIYIGIQFVTGGVEQKAKVKETLIAYIAGCIVVFGGFTIWRIVVTIMQSTT